MLGKNTNRNLQNKECDRIIDTQNLDVYAKRVGPWECKVTDQEIRLGPEHISQMQSLICDWLASNPHQEDTWVKQTYGVPTLVVRFDCTISDGVLCFYEIEERPQGIGSANVLNPFFAGQLAEIRKLWPEFVSVETPAHAARGSDDFLWVEQVPMSQCPQSGLLLVRSEPYEEDAWLLAGRSVGDIRTEGEKHYGVALGWWEEVTDPSLLPWDERFVLKPMQGSKCLAVTMWLGSGKQNKRPGAATRSKIEQILEEHGVMHCQRYHPPYEVMIDGKPHHMMLRPFFGFVPQTGEWRYMGGEWLIDRSVKLHGTPTTIFGRLT